MTIRIACVIALALVGSGVGLLGQPGKPQSPVIPDSLAGSDSFNLYCATCHGSGGRGDGPVASALRTRPADLTRLSLANNGAYPRERVTAFVTGTGRALNAHGTTEMPIWGPIFRAFESDARVRVRLDNLVTYIASIQAPTSGKSAPGAQAFHAYCASCHGASAHGDGVLAGELRRQPPDLTRFAQRNGGVFPEERLRRIIDGREVRAHGNSEMPVWGDAFRAGQGGLTAEEAQARILAILRYLQAIQERPA